MPGSDEIDFAPSVQGTIALTSGQLEITGVGTTPSRGLRRGVVINIETTARSIAAAIRSGRIGLSR